MEDMVNLHKVFSAALLAGLWLAQSQFAQAGLIGFYTLNGNANDTSGNGNNGTMHGSVSYTANAPFGGSNRANFVSVPISSVEEASDLPANVAPRRHPIASPTAEPRPPEFP